MHASKITLIKGVKEMDFLQGECVQFLHLGTKKCYREFPNFWPWPMIICRTLRDSIQCILRNTSAFQHIITPLLHFKFVQWLPETSGFPTFLQGAIKLHLSNLYIRHQFWQSDCQHNMQPRSILEIVEGILQIENTLSPTTTKKKKWNKQLFPQTNIFF